MSYQLTTKPYKRNILLLILNGYFTFLTLLQQQPLSITCFILFFNWILICLSKIDWEHYLLPDQLTLLLMWCGLLINVRNIFTDSTSSILGAAGAYLGLWCFNQLFFLISKRQGMGYGDFKLFAAIGAWLGWQVLPNVLLSASMLALIFALFLSLKRKKICRVLPFGPFLSFSAMVVMLSISHQKQWNFFLWPN